MLMKRVRRLARKLLLGKNYSETPARCFMIFGCQRSGTSITQKVLGRSDRIEIYGELHLAAHYRPYDQTTTDMRFRSKEEIRRLLLATYKDIVVFKPIHESQYAQELLDRHRAKAIWLYRHYDDVARSAVAMFGDRLRDFVHRIRNDEWGDLGWMVEGMSRDTILTLKDLANPELSAHEGACLFWWSRNRYFIEKEYYKDPRFLLLKYDRMCSDPVAEFARVFRFLEAPFHANYVDQIRSSSPCEKSPLPMRKDILQLCQQCLLDLDSFCTPTESMAMKADMTSQTPSVPSPK